MAVFGTESDRPLYGRGPSPGFRFTLYAVAVGRAHVLDQRGHWLSTAALRAQAAAYPVQLAVNSPPAAWRWLTRERSQTPRRAARRERAAARARSASSSCARCATTRWRARTPSCADCAPRCRRSLISWLLAEIVSVETDPLRQRLLINRGARNGVVQGQAVLDDNGVLGQATHVGPWSAEVILITDPEHAMPVQIERTGLRTIAVGAGDPPSWRCPTCRPTPTSRAATCW